ncbi:hypothetical protein FOA52_011450 [Chlamydomonas sp. UWO 241]|nr:hypothetical protein FOA52_011450 [Chlamydomonas sp. UWO 241]
MVARPAAAADGEATPLPQSLESVAEGMARYVVESRAIRAVDLIEALSEAPDVPSLAWSALTELGALFQGCHAGSTEVRLVLAHKDHSTCLNVSRSVPAPLAEELQLRPHMGASHSPGFATASHRAFTDASTPVSSSGASQNAGQLPSDARGQLQGALGQPAGAGGTGTHEQTADSEGRLQQNERFQLQLGRTQAADAHAGAPRDAGGLQPDARTLIELSFGTPGETCSPTASAMSANDASRTSVVRQLDEIEVKFEGQGPSHPASPPGLPALIAVTPCGGAREGALLAPAHQQQKHQQGGVAGALPELLLHACASCEDDQIAAVQMPLAGTLARHAMAQGGLVLFSDVMAALRKYGQPWSDTFMEDVLIKKPVWVALVPLFVTGTPVGILMFLGDEPLRRSSPPRHPASSSGTGASAAAHGSAHPTPGPTAGKGDDADGPLPRHPASPSGASAAAHGSAQPTPGPGEEDDGDDGLLPRAAMLPVVAAFEARLAQLLLEPPVSSALNRAVIELGVGGAASAGSGAIAQHIDDSTAAHGGACPTAASCSSPTSAAAAAAYPHLLVMDVFLDAAGASEVPRRAATCGTAAADTARLSQHELQGFGEAYLRSSACELPQLACAHIHVSLPLPATPSGDGLRVVHTTSTSLCAPTHSLMRVYQATIKRHVPSLCLNQLETLHRPQVEEIEVVATVGRGAFGSVHLAIWRGMVTAVKFIRHCDEGRKVVRSAWEMAVCKTLSHAHLVHVYAVLPDVCIERTGRKQIRLVPYDLRARGGGDMLGHPGARHPVSHGDAKGGEPLSMVSVPGLAPGPAAPTHTESTAGPSSSPTVMQHSGNDAVKLTLAASCTNGPGAAVAASEQDSGALIFGEETTGPRCHVIIMEYCPLGPMQQLLKERHFLRPTAGDSRPSQSQQQQPLSGLGPGPGDPGTGGVAYSAGTVAGGRHARACSLTLANLLDAPSLPSEMVDLPLVLSLLIQIASAMTYMHSHNFVHCDLKPCNVLLRPHGNGLCAKVSDFGLVELCTINGPLIGDIGGTVTHTAPEVISKKQVTKACDVFSFGIMMFSLYCCKQPYADILKSNTDYKAVEKTIMHRVGDGLRPDFPPGGLTAYTELAQRCWDADPDARPTFDEILVALRTMRRQHVPLHSSHTDMPTAADGREGGPPSSSRNSRASGASSVFGGERSSRVRRDSEVLFGVLSSRRSRHVVPPRKGFSFNAAPSNSSFGAAVQQAGMATRQRGSMGLVVSQPSHKGPGLALRNAATAHLRPQLPSEPMHTPSIDAGGSKSRHPSSRFGGGSQHCGAGYTRSHSVALPLGVAPPLSSAPQLPSILANNSGRGGDVAGRSGAHSSGGSAAVGGSTHGASEYRDYRNATQSEQTGGDCSSMSTSRAHAFLEAAAGKYSASLTSGTWSNGGSTTTTGTTNAAGTPGDVFLAAHGAPPSVPAAPSAVLTLDMAAEARGSSPGGEDRTPGSERAHPCPHASACGGGFAPPRSLIESSPLCSSRWATTTAGSAEFSPTVAALSAPVPNRGPTSAAMHQRA